MAAPTNPFDSERLVSEFDLYDRSVDVVSAYHWLFTETKDLPATVEHFERYPKIRHVDGNHATPDFTVLFKDGSGLVAEIANLPLHDAGVDKLCRQLKRYDQLTSLPNSSDAETPVGILDVIYLVPIETAADAVRRIMIERMRDSTHEYSPSRPPVVIQFARTVDKYVFQVWPDSSVNGSLHIGSRRPNYAEFPQLAVKPEMFARVKVQYAFMNDPVSSLYLATRLWSSVFPSEFGAGKVEVDVETSQIVDLLRRHYGYGRSSDVRRAMEVLVAAGLAASTSPTRWRLRRVHLRGRDTDVPKLIADRVRDGVTGRLALPREPRSTARRPRAVTLFDDLDVPELDAGSGPAALEE